MTKSKTLKERILKQPRAKKTRRRRAMALGLPARKGGD